MSALLAWFPASWASKVAPCFIGDAGFRSNVLLGEHHCREIIELTTTSKSNKQYRKGARFASPNTPAMHKSDRPVRMANNSATVTVRTWPSPCPAKARRLSRRYRSCKPGKVAVAGVRNRRRMRTKASLSFVFALAGHTPHRYRWLEDSHGQRESRWICLCKY